MVIEVIFVLVDGVLKWLNLGLIYETVLLRQVIYSGVDVKASVPYGG